MSAIGIADFDAEMPAEIIATWRRCARTSSNFRACLQTPEWFSYRWQGASNRYLAILREKDGKLLAVTPLVRNAFDLRISIGKLSIGGVRLKGVLINGNVPLFPERNTYYQGLCEAILGIPLVDCVYMLGVPLAGPFAEFLKCARQKRYGWLLYMPEQRTQRYFYIDIRGSFAQYLTKFSAKTVKKIRYRIRAIERAIGDRIELVKVVNRDQVDWFLSAAGSVAAKSWQKKLVDIEIGQAAARKEVLEGFASERALRCYVLKAGEKVLAFAICFHLSNTCYFHETAYDPTWSQFSPGQSLLYLIIKDCFENEKPSIFHFGTGEADYKEMFSNQFGEEATFLILKSNFRNRLFILAHGTSRKLVMLLRSMSWAVRLLALKISPSRH
jgi:hypothetical protein